MSPIVEAVSPGVPVHPAAMIAGPAAAGDAAARPLASAAARAATAWIPTPSADAGSAMGGTALLQAVTNAIVGVPGDPAAVAAASQRLRAEALQRGANMAVAPGQAAAIHAYRATAEARAAAERPAAASTGNVGAADAAEKRRGASTGRAAGSGTTAATAATPARRSGGRRMGSVRLGGVSLPQRVHVTQVPSRYNPSPVSGNRDCGPASVVMALRMVGLKVPGVAPGAGAQAMISAARRLTGNGDHGASTTNHELGRALQSAGAKTHETASLEEIRAAMFRGESVILNGNPRHPGAYGHRISADKLVPYDGAHWMVVSGYDPTTREFIINDPMATSGTLRVTTAELEAYRGGSIGIVVKR